MADPVPTTTSGSWFVPYGQLTEALTLAKQLVPARVPMPVLGHALLQFDSRISDRMWLSATNLEHTVFTALKIPVHPQAVRAPQLLPVVHTLRALQGLAKAANSWDRDRSEVQLTFHRDQIAMSVFGLRVEMPAAVPVTEYPPPPDWRGPSAEVARVRAPAWKAAIKFVAVAAGTDPAQPALGQIRLNILPDGDAAELLATDGSRLTLCEVPLTPRPSGMSYPPRELLLPGKLVALTAKLENEWRPWHSTPGRVTRTPARRWSDVLRLRLATGDDGAQTLVIRDDRHLVLSRLLDAAYPERYRGLIPDATGPGGLFRWQVPAAQLIGAVKGVAATLDKADPVRVRFSPDGVGIATSEPIPSQTESDPDQPTFTAWFNAGFLLAAIGSFTGARHLILAGSAADKPWLFSAGQDGSWHQSAGMKGVHMLAPLRNGPAAG